MDSDSGTGAAKIAGMNLSSSSPPVRTLLSTPVLIALSLVYGGVLAVLGAIDSSAVGIVALIGAFVVGGLWVLRGVIERD